MSIDHEAAKNVCHARLEQDMHPSSSDRNIAKALLDLHEQLTAERARVDALAELVPRAFQSGLAHNLPPRQYKGAWNLSRANEELSRIMEGRA